MIKCRRKQTKDPQKLKKNCQWLFFRFLLVEAEAEAEVIGVEAEAFEKQPLPHPW